MTRSNRFPLLSLAAFAMMDPSAGCDSCSPQPHVPVTYSIPTAVAQNLMRTNDEATRALPLMEVELERMRGEGQSGRTMQATERFIAANAAALGSSSGANVDEQITNVLVAASAQEEAELRDIVAETQRNKDSNAEARAKEFADKAKARRQAIVEAFWLGNPPAARHEAAHTVQQQTTVVTRTIVPTRAWTEAGGALTAQVSCDQDVEVSLIDTTSGKVVATSRGPRGGSATMNSQTSSTRTSFAILLGTGGSGARCDVKFTAPMDVRSPSAVLSVNGQDAAALLNAAAELAESNEALRAALPTVPRFKGADLAIALSNASIAELAHAVATQAPVPHDDAVMAALAQGDWAGRMLAAIAEGDASDDAEKAFQALARVSKKRHDTALHGFANAR